MKPELNNKQFAIETASDFMHSANDYSIETASKLIKAIYKNLGYSIAGFEEKISSVIVDAAIFALSKKAESEGCNGDDYFQGVLGFDTSGRSTRDLTISISKDKKIAERSFDAGRRFVEKENYNWCEQVNKLPRSI